jgi:hypothetical protein
VNDVLPAASALPPKIHYVLSGAYWWAVRSGWGWIDRRVLVIRASIAQVGADEWE